MSMKGSLDRPPIVLTSLRWKSALRIVGCLGFVGLGAWLMTLGEDGPFIAGLASVACFGFFLVMSLVQLVRPSTLTIGPAGVTHAGPFRTTAYRWRDIDNIRLIRINRSQLVAFDLTESYEGSEAMTALSRQLAGVDCGLPTGWSIGPTDLARLLNEARGRWLNSGASFPATEPASRRTPPRRDQPPIVQ